MRTRSRKGLVLLAVMLVIVIAALIGSTLLVTVDAERSSAATTLRRTQSRAIAWSGVLFVSQQLAEHREDLLQGIAVDLEHEWTLYEEPGGRRAVVRLVPIGRDGSYVVSETGKVDLNHASKEMLRSLPGIDTDERAQRIIDARPFSSVEELVRVEGFAADLLYGFADAPVSVSTRGEEGVKESGDAQVMPGEGPVAPSGSEPNLIDLLTVFSFDPNIQAGIESPDKRGKLRINLNVPWSDRFERAIREQWGSEAVEVVKPVFERGMQFRTDRELIENLRSLGINDVGIIRQITDAVTTSDDMYRLGRIDILQASPTVLASLPGIDRARALEIADRRDRLSDDARLSAMWLVEEGVVTLDEYGALADLVTTRSMQWRVRVEAGFEDPPAYERVAGVAESVLEGFAELTGDEPPLQDRVVYDAVIDVASERPRVAYLRDVTMLELAQDLRRSAVEDRLQTDQRAYEEELRSVLGLDGSGDGVNGTDEDVQPDRAGSDPSWRAGSRIDADRAARAQRREARTTTAQNRRGERAQPGHRPEPTRTMPGEPVDRRIGRWRSGGGS